jgi:hypothetical protein
MLALWHYFTPMIIDITRAADEQIEESLGGFVSK